MKSKYKGISHQRSHVKSEHLKDGVWYATKIVKGKKYKSPGFKEERDAALAYDKILISLGLEPVNILKRKNAKKEKV